MRDCKYILHYIQNDIYKNFVRGSRVNLSNDYTEGMAIELAIRFYGKIHETIQFHIDRFNNNVLSCISSIRGWCDMALNSSLSNDERHG